MNKISFVFTMMTCTVYINVYGQEENTQLRIAPDYKNTTIVDSLENAADYHLFKASSEEKIKTNDEMIAVLKEKFSGLDTYKKVSNQKRVAKLERRNMDLNEELTTYTGEIHWDDFKVKFSNDLDELQKELTKFRE